MHGCEQHVLAAVKDRFRAVSVMHVESRIATLPAHLPMRSAAMAALLRKQKPEARWAKA